MPMKLTHISLCGAAPGPLFCLRRSRKQNKQLFFGGGGNPPNGCHPGEREGTRFPNTLILVGYVGFSASSKNQHTPLQSRGTRQRAFFAVRKQHTKQVPPVEGLQPSAGFTPLQAPLANG
jgi:hypothetical protein